MCIRDSDKDTGEIIGEIEAPARSNYGMSSWTHDGHQYIMLQTSSKLTALALPGAQVESSAHYKLYLWKTDCSKGSSVFFGKQK